MLVILEPFLHTRGVIAFETSFVSTAIRSFEYFRESIRYPEECREAFWLSRENRFACRFQSKSAATKKREMWRYGNLVGSRLKMPG